MLKLFVDDYRPAPQGWVQAKTVTEAIRMIMTYPRDIETISLDHDIENSAETFMAVAHFLVMFLKDRKSITTVLPKINIHTGNPDAGDRMAAILLKEVDIVATRIDCMELYASKKF